MNMHYSMRPTVILGAIVLTSAFFAHQIVAQDIQPSRESVKAPKKEYSPYIEDNFPTIKKVKDFSAYTK